VKKRIVNGIFAVGLLLCIIGSLAPLESAAAPEKIILEARPESDAVYEGQKLEIILSFTGLTEPAACFDMTVEFDDKRLELKKVTPRGEISGGELYFHTVGSTAYLVYTDKEGGKSPVRNGEAVSLTYQVKEGALAGEASFAFQCAAIGDSRAGMLGMASARCTVMVTPPPSGNAMLSRLVPSAGRLVPGFTPENFTYSLEVGAAVDRVGMSLKTAHPGAAAKVNRESLNGKGKSTRLIVTVSAPDGSKQKYTITVLRRKEGKTTLSKGTGKDGTEIQPGLSAIDSKRLGSPDTQAPLKARTLSLYWLLGTMLLFAAVPVVFHFLRRYTVNFAEKEI